MDNTRKKNRGRRAYFICLTIYTLALSVAAVFALSIVWNFAEEYEASRPGHAIEAYVKELSENQWVDSIADTLSAMPHEAQSNAECAELVREMLSKDITYTRKAGAGAASYALLCNGSEFGRVTLVEDQDYADRVKFGMLPWKVDTEEFDFTGLYSTVEITVPSTFTVELNGYELEEQHIVEKDIKLDVLEDYYDTVPNLPTKVTYRFENAIGELTPTVYDENGEEFLVDAAKDDSQYIVPCSDAVLARLSDFAYEFSDRYFHYITGLTDPVYGYDRLSTVMKLGSDLDERMKRAMDGLSWAHTSSLRIDSVVLNGGINLGDGFYVADVSTQTTTFQPGQGEVVGTHNMKIVVEDSANELRAHSMELY